MSHALMHLKKAEIVYTCSLGLQIFLLVLLNIQVLPINGSICGWSQRTILNVRHSIIISNLLTKNINGVLSENVLNQSYLG